MKQTITINEPPRALRIPAACSTWGMGKSLLYQLAREGRIRLVRIAGRTVVPASEIERLVREGA
jgi:predicted DNA-binding transcriptional regulator AlpA